MTEGGGDSSPEVAAGTAQGFTKEAIGAATSKLISASIGDIVVGGVIVVSLALITSMYNIVLADPAFRRGSQLGKISDHNSEDGPAYFQKMTDTELREVATSFAKALVDQSANGTFKVRAWGKNEVTYKILFPSQSRGWMPYAEAETRILVQTELTSIGKAARVKFLEAQNSGEAADITIKIERPGQKANPSQTSSSGRTLSSEIEDSNAELQLDGSIILGAECTIKFDLARLCRGRTLLHALKTGHSVEEICKGWSDWSGFRSNDLNYIDKENPGLRDALDGCLLSSRHFQKMAFLASNWQPHWHRQLRLCALQSVGFSFREGAASSRQNPLKTPRVRIDGCLVDTLCQQSGRGYDPEVHQACGDATTISGAEVALTTALAIQHPSPSSVVDAIVAALRSGRSGLPME